MGGLGFEMMGVASWHKQTLPTKLPLYLGRILLIDTRIWWVSFFLLYHASRLCQHCNKHRKSGQKGLQ